MPQPNELPGPNSDFWDWQMHGVCRGVDSSVFFHPDGERLALVRDRQLAFFLARQNELTPVSVH